MFDSSRRRRNCRHFAVLVLMAWTALFAFQGGFDAEPVGAQVTPLEDEPEEAPTLGRITGSPDPGPAPEDAGDRGGLIQLGLAILLFSGLIFIVWRIRAESVRNRQRRPSDHPEH